MEVLVGHCLRETQVVGIQRGRELSYGTEAQVWGTGTILIYKIDVWQILISTVMPQSHFNTSDDSAPSSQNSYKIRKRDHTWLICFRPRRKLQRTVLLTAESAESTLSLFMQMDESVEQHDENIWQIHLLRTVFAGGG